MNDKTKNIPVHDTPHIKFSPLPPGSYTPWDDIDDRDEDAVTMQEILQDLDDCLIGQYSAKKAASQIIWSAFSPLGPSTNLFIGRTGSGKTELFRAIEKQFRKTVYWCDCSALSSEGYKGTYKISTILDSIPKDGHVHILCCDEFDKLIDKTSDSVPYHYMIQDELLRLFDHDVADNKLTVVCMGAFAPLYEKKQKAKKQGIGFSSTPSDDTNNIIITREDLIEYGFKPELIGRFDKVIQMDDMSKEVMRQIVDTMCKKLEAKLRKPIHLSDANADAIANEAFEAGLGARGVRSRLRCMVEDYIFDHPHSMIIDLETKEEAPEMLV